MDENETVRTVAALDDAVAALIRESREAPFGVPEPDVLAEEIRVVGRLIRDCLEGVDPVDPPPAQADRPGILDALRARTLAAWEGDDGLLRVMRAFEAARAGLVHSESPLPPGTLSPYGHRLLREVAHMMRSPLGSVVMLAATLKEGVGGQPTALQAKHLGLIHRAAVSLAALSSDLLALGGEDAELRADPAAFEVDRAVGSVADALAPVAEERGVDLRVRSADVGRRLGRELAVSRALVNLGLNALLLVREGALELTAEEAGDADVRFGVRATAASEDPAALFVVFPSQGDTDDYTMSSRGLGFAVAREVVRRMGSKLVAERGSGGGLELTFTLGLARSD